MSYYITYSALDQFVAGTVHTADVHNTPHNRLLNNDVVLDTNLQRVEQITFNQGLDIAALQSAPSPVIALTKSYNSGGQTITANGSLLLSHGLGMIPKVIFYYLVCISADAGFSPGEYLDANNFTYSAGGGTTSGISAVFNASTLAIYYANNANVFIAIHKTGRYGANLTNASWQLIINAFA
jgi:hypothetical protein